MDLNTESPIHTHSDALFVAFVNKHRPNSISFDAIDDLIALLRMHDFDSSQITFDNATDMMMYNAENSRISALQRASTKTYVHLPVPQLIVDLVADHLAQESTSIFAQEFFIRDCPSRAALLNMALVHRTWTNAAQRVLRQRITFNDSVGSLEGLALGPWVREMVYMPEDYFQTLPSFLEARRACPNICNLCIILPGFIECDHISTATAINEIIEDLPNFPNLTRLCLRNFSVSCDITPCHMSDFSKQLGLSFIRILPKLTALKTLALYNWPIVPSEPTFSSLALSDEIDPPNLDLTSLSCDIADRFLPYILRLSNGLTSLELDSYAFDESIESPAASKVVYDKLSEISSFRFRVDVRRKEPDCFDLFTKCVKLRQLTIDIADKLLVEPVQTISSTLEHLWIHYSYCDKDESQDRCIVETVKRLSNLKTLTITTIDRRRGQGPLFVFKEVPTYCSEKSIELIIKYDTWLPPFA